MMAEPEPYANACDAYADAGWEGIIPVQGKWPPPPGYTGHEGVDPDFEQRLAWKQNSGHRNIGLRLPPGFMAIDVDDYNGKNGWATLQALEAEWGKLPDGPISTSRTDGRSGIRLFRLRDPAPLTDKPGPGIEIIQHHHRYVMAWPSIHPDTGDMYRWIEQGAVIDIPTTDDVPLAPEKWETGLRKPRVRTGATSSPSGPRGGHWTQAVEDALASAMAELPGGRHDGALHGSSGLIRLRHLGYPGAEEALERLESTFLSAVIGDGSRTERQALEEWQRMVQGAEELVASTPSTIKPYAELMEELKAEDPAMFFTAKPKGKTKAKPAPEAPLVTDWDEPVPLGEDERLTGFPVDVLPKWADDMVRGVAGELQVPVDLPAMLFLGGMSTIAAGRVKVAVAGGWAEGVNLYLCPAMPPGSGKSPAFKRILAPVYEYEAELIEKARPAAMRYEQEQRMIEKAMKRAEDAGDRMLAGQLLMEKETAERVTIPQLISEDATPEALVGVLADNNERVAELSTEGTLFETMASERYNTGSAGQYNLYLKGFSGDPHRENRVARGRNDLDSVTLTVCVTVQPAVLEKLAAKPELAGVGLTARFAYSLPPNLVGWRDFLGAAPVDPAVGDTYRANMLAVARDLGRHQVPRRLQLSPEALDLFSRWYQRLEPRRKEGRDLHLVAEWTEKLRVMVVRVAGLLHLAFGHDWDEIDLDTFQRALRIAEYWLDHAKAIHAIWAGHSLARTSHKVLKWIVRGRREVFTARDCYRDLHIKADVLRPTLELLADLGWVRQVSGEWGRGRGQVAVYRSHPSLTSDAPPADFGATFASEAPESGSEARVTDSSPDSSATGSEPDSGEIGTDDHEITPDEGKSTQVTRDSKYSSDDSLYFSGSEEFHDYGRNPVTNVTLTPTAPWVPDPNARPDEF